MAKKNSSTSSSNRYSASPAAKAPEATAPVTPAKDAKVTPSPVSAAAATSTPAAAAHAATAAATPAPATAAAVKATKPAAESKPATATSAVAGHGKSTDATIVSALIADLRGSDADVARDAAISLGTHRSAAAVEPLIEVVNNVDGYYHAVVRAAAASSLAQIGDVRAVESLLGAVRDPQAEPSAEAIRALATLADPRAVSVLVEVVRNATGYFSSIARRAAIIALSSFQNEQAIAELRAVSDDTWEDSVIRQAAIDALQEVSSKRPTK